MLGKGQLCQLVITIMSFKLQAILYSAQNWDEADRRSAKHPQQHKTQASAFGLKQADSMLYEIALCEDLNEQ